MDEDQQKGRQQALDHILQSEAPRKLIVAGPGTGKTYTFRRMLEGGAGPNLALTFIKALADDLAESLGDLAETYTFHGFCRRLLHTTPTAGITLGVDYYTPLMLLIAEDLTCLEGRAVDVKALDHDFHYLDDGDGLLAGAMRSGNYYNAVSHLDSVYRVLSHLEAHPEDIPTYAQVVVDEYQDFSLLEARFIESMASGSPTLIVGDDDQALYSFKHASALYIRDLAANADYERFELPYCTRCTRVLVDSVHTVIEEAKSQGLLTGRIDKRYECYLPDKAADSERYPSILHVYCTVQKKNAPYIAKYIHQQIIDISADEIKESRENGHPTVLITGPPQFVGPVFDYLARYFDDIALKRSAQAEVRPLDGYRRLARDPGSRLGWRILLHVHQPRDLCNILSACLIDGHEISERLPDRYRTSHLEYAAMVGRLRAGESLTAEEIPRLESALGMTYRDLLEELKLGDASQEGEEPAETSGTDTDAPSIICTTLVGAKGLQAAHTFVIGLNEGHFPRSNKGITDDEVCCLLVALTRAKKSCTLISCGRFGSQQPGASVFTKWLKPHISELRVDAQFFRDLGSGGAASGR